MKKFFAVLFLSGFLAILVMPMVASAQATGNVADCCRVRRGFSFDAVNYNTDQCVTGALSTSSCPVGVCASFATGTDAWGMVCVLNTIYRVADLIFAVLLAVSILLILLAAWTFITAGGAPEKVNKARDYIFYALIGLVVAFLARAIPSIVKLLV